MPMYEDAPCQFLKTFPPELRLMVYEHLLVHNRPVTVAASENAEKLEEKLDLEILKVNRQIHDEAAAVFYGKNTLRVKPKVVAGKFETIAPRYRHLVRNLSVEVLHCPSGPTAGWKKTNSPDPSSAATAVHNHETETYISALSSLLLSTPHISTLTLTITPPSHPSKQILAALLPLTNPQPSPCVPGTSLPSVLPVLGLSAPPELRFEFDDCFYRARVDPQFLQDNGILLLACKVLFWKSHLRVERAVREAEGRGMDGHRGKGDGRVDLEGLVGEGVEKLMERGREVQGWRAAA